ncbi:hypothetical protein PG984_011545 [Apiospora sp. TS-2023a]
MEASDGATPGKPIVTMGSTKYRLDFDIYPRLASKAAEDCTPLPLGPGPIPPMDSTSGFLSHDTFYNSAAGTLAPANYSLKFQGIQASDNAYGHMNFISVPS